MEKRKEVYSDEYIEAAAELYLNAGTSFDFFKKGVRFEAFLASPQKYIDIATQITDVEELIEKHELEIEKLPGGGTRFGKYFQQMNQKKKNRRQRRKHITEERIHA